GAAGVFAGIGAKIGYDVWSSTTTPSVSNVTSGVMNSISILLASAFTGWLVVKTAKSKAMVPLPSKNQGAWDRLKELFKLVRLDSAPVVAAALIYLAMGAFAGLTYLCNQSTTPTALITVATAWAAQASAVVASNVTAVTG